MDDLDDGFFPNSALPIVAGAALLLAVGLIWLAPMRSSPPPQPPAYLGCYKSDGGPPILVDDKRLHVLQEPALTLPYTLEYIKGWVLLVDNGLAADLHPKGAGQLHSDTSTVYLSLNFEGEVASVRPQFEVFDSMRLLAITYRWSGLRCDAVGTTGPEGHPD